MKSYITGLTFLISITAFSQQMTWEQWQKEAATNINLLPKYGQIERTKKQKKGFNIYIPWGNPVEKERAEKIGMTAGIRVDVDILAILERL